MPVVSSELDIDRKSILNRIGYGAEHTPPARIESLVNEYADNICDLIEPAYFCVFRKITAVIGPYAIIEGWIILKSQVIARLLKKCDRVAILVLTIGDHLEEMVQHLSKEGLVLQASVLDVIGSSAVEAAANAVHDLVHQNARAEGLFASQRFSPGYCDWNISQQKKVFRALRNNTVGVTLTKKCLMLPRKSVSGIIGIGPREVTDYNPCQTCPELECDGRR